jgi:thioredoxin-related protein
MKKIILTIACLLLASPAMRAFCQQNTTEGLVQWISLEEAEKRIQNQPRPIMIDFYTDWCGWCKHMMKTTFSDPGIASYINAYFYPVRLNAESRDTIVFRGETFVNKSSGNRPPHDLAIKMLDGRLSYPSIVFFNNNYQFKLIVPGYLDPRQIEPILVYTLEYIFMTTGVEDFREHFKRAFYPDSSASHTPAVWYNWDEARKISEKKKSKLLVFITATGCNSCRVMEKATLTDSSVRILLDNYFTLVLFDAQSQETITAEGMNYLPAENPQQIHAFLNKYLNGRLTLPNMLFFDENGTFVTAAPQFMTAASFLPVLEFIGKDIFRTSSWDDFMKHRKESGE